MRWYEVNIATYPTNVYIKQWGDLSHYANESTFQPSIDIDALGNVAIAFMMSSKTRPPALAYTTRLATDPLGTMRYPYTFPVPTTLSYVVDPASVNANLLFTQFGDHTTCQVDPVSRRTFFVSGEQASPRPADLVAPTVSTAWVLAAAKFDIRASGGPLVGAVPSAGPPVPIASVYANGGVVA